MPRPLEMPLREIVQDKRQSSGVSDFIVSQKKTQNSPPDRKNRGKFDDVSNVNNGNNNNNNDEKCYKILNYNKF